MKIAQSLLEMAQKGKEAARQLRMATTEAKNRALLAIAEELEAREGSILAANEADLLAASDLAEAMRDRLSLQGRLHGIIADVRNVVQLPDPVGEIFESRVLPNGLKICKKRVPIGMLGVIYEARPNVTVDIASLALKTGNCAILRGGKETLRTNLALMDAVQQGVSRAGLPIAALQLIKTPHRSQVKQLVKLDAYIDMIIPRGGAGLHQFCRQESTIPVITGGIGICHLFVDEKADLTKSIPVIVNAKTQRPSVCNALDTLLIHRKVASHFLPKMIDALKPYGVTFYLDTSSWDILKPSEDRYHLATEKAWETEWLNLTLGIKIVSSMEEAIAHIQRYSTNHSDGILTDSAENAAYFTEAIDSSAVYVNASTRFTDGGEFGLGAEVAVSTQKLHARGPMGLRELTTYKWIATGNYHIRK